MRLLYSLVYSLALIFVFPFEYRKRPGSVREKWLREKLGKMKSGVAGQTTWVHAVSVGEVLAAETFIRALKKEHPGLRVVVSTITDTGQKVARERLGNLAEAIYMPLDLGFIMNRAIRALRPSIFIIMETEIWPNAIWSMKRAGIPVLMLNGRISEGSFRGYRKIRFFMERVFSDVNELCMQDEAYAKRIVDIGAPNGKVKVTGNFKFDVSLPGEKPAWGGLFRGPVIVAGSTHRGEESLMISIYEKLKTEFGDLNLVIAPRHPERFEEVEGLLKNKWLKYARKTKLGDSVLSGCVVLLDTIGELSAVYSIADIAVVGGSFIEHGGQNPLEPAYWGKPVVCGPHMDNFPFIEEFYGVGAAVPATRETLYDNLKHLLLSPDKRREIGEAAGALLRRNRGAVDRAVKAVERFL